MSKSIPGQRITTLKEWMQQLERESRTFNRHRKTVKKEEDVGERHSGK